MADEIRTERLLMRRATWDDLAPLHAIFTNPDNMHYWSTTVHEDMDQTREWLRSMIEADPANSDDYILEYEGECIGKLGCWEIHEIGFMVAHKHTGKGLASEALGAFLEHRRKVAPGSKIVADVDPRNVGSLRLLEKHGFVETGRRKDTWEVGGVMTDSVDLEINL